MLLFLLKGESDDLAAAPASGQMTASRAASMLSLRLGGDEVQRVFRRDFLLSSEEAGGAEAERSSWR